MSKQRSEMIKKQSDEGKNARSLPIAAKGISNDRDFSVFMSALMSDLIEGTVSPIVGNAAINAGGKLLKVVEMRQRYGRQVSSKGEKLLRLTPA